MLHTEAPGLLAGAVALGAIHGIEPGHGWPVAAAYALDQTNKWLYGFAASFILGVGHLVSSIAMVGAFFYAKAYFDLTQVNEPMTVAGFQVGGPVSVVAGLLLIALGIREYYGGHSHGHGTEDGGHDHGHGDREGDQGHGEHGHAHGEHGHEEGHGHAHGEHSGHAQGHDGGHPHGPEGGHAHAEAGLLARIGAVLPFVGGHAHDHGDPEEAADRGLLGIAWFAFLLGFAHEEEFEIIALCAGSEFCLELMAAYALTVIAGIVGLTMLLIAGYQNYEATVERYTPYLPAFAAAVLVIMGLGFVLGLF